jgi:replication initiation and membrane attachment protein
MELTLSVHDRLRLVTKTYLAPYHEQIIYLLYQPIIGFKAVSLYMTLWSLIMIEKGELTLSHSQILTFFDYDLTEFNQVKKKLEAIDLLNVYYHNSEGFYLYELRQPLTSKQFFQDSRLNVHLLYQVGYNLYAYLEERFLIKNTTMGLTNITTPFCDVFPTVDVVKKMDNENKEYVVNTTSQFQAPLNYGFDYELFLALLNKSFISEDMLGDQLQARIMNDAALYQFDAQMMSKIVLDCVDPKGALDLDSVHKKAASYYKRLKTKRKNKEIKPSVTEEEFQPVEDITERQKIALFNYKTKTPHEWLKILQNNTEVPHSYLEVVRVLFEEYHLPTEVINVLVEFVRSRNDGRLPLEYSKAIASSWIFKGIKLAEEAMKEIEKIVAAEASYVKKGEVAPTYTKKNWSRKAGHTATEPEWLAQHEENRRNAKEELEDVDLVALEKLLSSFK